MKKIILEKNTKERNNDKIKNIIDLDKKTSIIIINNLFLDISNNNIVESNLIKKELECKIRGYKGQDIKKNIYDDKLLITYNELLEKLVISKLKCFYCRKDVKLIYKLVRDEDQWTLDRINNDVCHSNKNTIICCLKCNLKRRNIDSKKFEFTKKLILNKKE